MKGRPPGTPKSDDPAKKKRKRFARERDLCDVKIKITEHFPDATFSADGTINASPTSGFLSLHQFPDGTVRSLGGPTPTKKYWTIQRVNGNGGNGKGDGVPGPHKHTLQKSDEIKKSTVQRFLAAQEKEARKGQVSINTVSQTENALFGIVVRPVSRRQYPLTAMSLIGLLIIVCRNHLNRGDHPEML